MSRETAPRPPSIRPWFEYWLTIIDVYVQMYHFVYNL